MTNDFTAFRTLRIHLSEKERTCNAIEVRSLTSYRYSGDKGRT
jgi:hypothetical protein